MTPTKRTTQTMMSMRNMLLRVCMGVLSHKAAAMPLPARGKCAIILTRAPLRAVSSGDVAQLGEHHVRNVGAEGSNPFISTTLRHRGPCQSARSLCFADENQSPKSLLWEMSPWGFSTAQSRCFFASGEPGAAAKARQSSLIDPSNSSSDIESCPPR